MRKPLAKLSKAVLMTAAALITCAPPAKAVNYFWWDANGSTVGVGGSGKWNNVTTTDKNWTSPAQTSYTAGVAPSGSATSFFAWSNNSAANVDVAVFAGVSGTTTLVDAKTYYLNGVIAEVDQTITGDILGSGKLQFIGSAPQINVASSKTLTLAASVGGNFTKLGAGTLKITKSSFATSTITLSDGVLSLGDFDALKTATLSVLAASTGSFTFDAGPSGNYSIGGFNVAKDFSLGSNTLILGNLTSTVTGKISGTGSIIKQGTANLTLSGPNNNDYSGGTTISAGTLSAGKPGALGTGAVTVNGGTLNLASAGSSAVSPFGGVSSLSISSGSVTGGYLQASISVSGASTISSNLVGSTTLLMAGSGTLNLTGTANTYSGITTISSGTMAVSGGNALSASAVTVVDGTLSLNTAATVYGLSSLAISGAGTVLSASNSSFTVSSGPISVTLPTGTATITANIAGSTSINMTGAGVLSLASSGNTFSGGTTISAGTLLIGNANALGTGILTINGGALDISTAYTIANPLAIGGNFAFAGTANLTQTTGAVTLNASPTISINGTSSSTLRIAGSIGSTSNSITKAGVGVLYLSGNNQYSGGTTLQAGTLKIGHANALGTGPLTIGGGTLDAASAYTVTNAFVIGADFTYAGTADLTQGTGDVTLNATSAITVNNSGTNARTLTFGGSIVGTSANSLDKYGVGTLTLASDNSYLGSTYIGAGTLIIQTSKGLGTGAVGIQDLGTTVGAGGVLSFKPVGSLEPYNPATGTRGFDIDSPESITLNDILGGSASFINSAGINRITGKLHLSGGDNFGAEVKLSTKLYLSGGIEFDSPSAGVFDLLLANGAATTEAQLYVAGDIKGRGKIVVAGALPAWINNPFTSSFSLTRYDVAAGTTVLYGDNKDFVGGLVYVGNTSQALGRLVAGTPSALGRGDVEMRQGSLKLQNDINLGAGKITFGSAGTTWVDGDIGRTTLISGRAAMPLDGSYVLATSTGTGSLTASQYIFYGTSSVNVTLGNTGAGPDGNLANIASSLAKSGTGTLTLAKDNSYLGATQIDGGTVLIQSVKALGAGAVGVTDLGTTVGSAGRLQLQPLTKGYLFPTDKSPIGFDWVFTEALTLTAKPALPTLVRTRDTAIRDLPLSTTGELLTNYNSTDFSLSNLRGFIRIVQPITLTGSGYASIYVGDTSVVASSATVGGNYLELAGGLVRAAGSNPNLYIATHRREIQTSYSPIAYVSYLSKLAVTGDLDLGQGGVVMAVGGFDDSYIWAEQHLGGQVGLYGDNRQTGGKISINNSTVFAGSPTALGSGDVEVGLYYSIPTSNAYVKQPGVLNVQADVVHAGKFVLTNGSSLISDGVVTVTNGRGAMSPDGSFAATDTTTKGTLTSGSYELRNGTVAVSLGDNGGAGSYLVKNNDLVTTDGINWTAGANTIVTLNNPNQYRGLTEIKQGTLNITNSYALGTTDAGTVVFSGAQLKLTSLGLTIAGARTTAGSKVVTVASTSGLSVSMEISGGSVQAGSIITALTSNTFTLSKSVGASSTSVNLNASAYFDGPSAFTTQRLYDLSVAEDIDLAGTGADTASALYSSSGINRITGNIRMTDSAGIFIADTTKLYIDGNITASNGVSGKTLVIDGAAGTGTANEKWVVVGGDISVGANKVVLSGPVVFAFFGNNSGSTGGFERLDANVTSLYCMTPSALGGGSVASSSRIYAYSDLVIPGTLTVSGTYFLISAFGKSPLDAQGRSARPLNGALTPEGSTLELGTSLSAPNGVMGVSTLSARTFVFDSTVTHVPYTPVVRGASGVIDISLGDLPTGAGATLTKYGVGDTTLRQANTYTGRTWINLGYLRINDSQSLGSAIGDTTINNGQLRLAAKIETAAQKTSYNYGRKDANTQRSYYLDLTERIKLQAANSTAGWGLVNQIGVNRIAAPITLIGPGVDLSGASTSLNSPLITVSSTAGLAVGMEVSGAGIPDGATVAALASPVTMSAARTTSSSSTVTVNSVNGLVIGMGVSGTYVQPGTTIASVGTNTITLSSSATGTGTVNLSASGLLTLTQNATADANSSLYARYPASLTSQGVALPGATIAANSKIVTVASTAGLAVNMLVTGEGIPVGAYIASITNGTTFNLNANATSAGSRDVYAAPTARILVVGSDTKSAATKLYLGASSVDSLAKTVVGTGAALNGGGANLVITAANNAYTYPGELVMMGDLNLGAGQLRLDSGTAGQVGGFLSLLGDNASTTGGMVFNGKVNAGTPTSLGRGSVNLQAGLLRVFHDVDIGAGTLTLTAGTIESVGRFQTDSNGRAIVMFDGDMNPTDPLGRGTIKARKYEVSSGTISVSMLGGLAAADSVVKSGTGTVFLSGNNLFDGNVTVGGGILEISGANVYSGSTTISSGALRAKHSSALGSTSGATTVSSGASLYLSSTAVGLNIGESIQLAGTGVSSKGALYNESGSNTYSGSVALAASSRINAALSTKLLLNHSDGVVGVGYSLTVGGDGDTQISGRINIGSGGLTKDGLGTLTLNGQSDFTGAVAVSTTTLGKGTLLVEGSLGSASIGIGAGAVFGGNGSVGGPVTFASSGSSTLIVGAKNSGGDFRVGNLTFQGYGRVEVAGLKDFLSQPALTVDANMSVGTVVGSITINVAKNSSMLDNGTYRIIQYGGSLSGSQSAFKLTGMSLGVNRHFNLDFTTPNQINLTIGGDAVRWTGAAEISGASSGAWDINKLNWKLKGDHEGVIAKFVARDDVYFDDTASGPTTVALAAAVTAANVVFDNTTKDYVVSGSAVTTGTLSKTGSGLLTMSGANSVTGGSTITGGRVRVGHNGSLGNTEIELDGGGLSSNSTTSRTLANLLRISSDTATLGDPVDNGALTFNGTVNLAGSSRKLTVHSAVTFANFIGDDESLTTAQVSGGSGFFEKAGVGTLTLKKDLAHGVRTANAETGGFDYSGDIYVSAGTLSIGDGGATGSVYSNIKNDGNLVFNRSGAQLDYGASISGAGSMEKKGAAWVLNLTGDNTMSGLTTVSAGTLLVNGSLKGSVQVASGATLGGSGTIGGSVQIASGATHSPGNSPGVQSIVGNLSYLGGSTVAWELKDNSNSQTSPATFDQIMVGGNLHFAGPTTMSLNFNPAGSTVSWANAFWDAPQEWAVYVVDGTITGIPDANPLTSGNLTLTSNWTATNGALATSRPNASFNLGKSGNSIVLYYTPGGVAAGFATDVVLQSTHVGVAFADGTINVQNIAAAGSSDLDATATGLAGAVSFPAGPDLLGVAAQSSGQIGVSLATPTSPGVSSANVTLSYLSQPGAVDVGSQVVVVSGTAYQYAAPSVTTVADSGKIRIGSSLYGAFQPAVVTVSNQATSATYGESLQAQWSSPAPAGVILTGALTSPIAPRGSSSVFTAVLVPTSVAGYRSVDVGMDLTSKVVAGAVGLGDTVLEPGVVRVIGAAYNPAIGDVAAADRVVDLGRIRVGGSFAARNLSITNIAVADPFTELLSASFRNTDAGLQAVGGVVDLVAGTSSQAMSVNWTQTATPGAFNKRTTVQFATSGSGLPQEDVNSQQIQVTGIIDALAAPSLQSSTLNCGRIHVGGIFSEFGIVVNNDLTASSQESLNVDIKSPVAGLSAVGSVSGLAAGQTSTNDIRVRITETAAGKFTKTLSLSARSKSADNAVQPLDLADMNVAIRGLAYTGKSSWIASSNPALNIWGDGSNESHWTRWAELGGIPGIDGVLSVGDTATFASDSHVDVALSVSPELQSLIFAGSGGATISATGAESFLLGKGVSLAEVKALAGANLVNVPISLYQDLRVTATASASVAFAGPVSAVSASRLSIVGSDLSVLGGTADFASAVVGGLAVDIEAARMTSSVDQAFGAVSLKSGALASSGTAGSVNLTVASLEKVASGNPGYDTFMLGDAMSPSKLNLALATAPFVDVRSGDLRNNAYIAAPVFVRAGATLGGVGKSGAVSVADSATFSPGNVSRTHASLVSGDAFGTYTANSITLSNGSFFNVTINAGNNSALSLISGSSVLGGHLTLSYFGQSVADAGITSATRYTIITNGTQARSGAFSDVAFDPEAAAMFDYLLTPYLDYFSDRVELAFNQIVVSAPGRGTATDVNLGATHVLQPFVPGASSIGNIADPGSGTITAELTAPAGSSAVVLFGGVVAGVQPGASAPGLVSLQTPATVGAKSAQVLVTFTSQPGGVSAGTATINVTGTAYEYASANILNSVDLGSIRRGSLLYGTFHAATVPLTNLATSANYGEKLSANWQGTSAGYVVTNGSVNNLNPQANSNALSLNLSSALPASAYNETATLRLTSVSLTPDLQDTPTDVVVGVTGRVYNPAAGSTSSTVNLGMTRVGVNFQTQPITVTNTAAPGLFTETLKAELLSPTGGVTTSGSLSALQAGQQLSTLGVGSTNVATPGAKSGTVNIRFTTEGTVSGLPDEVLGIDSTITVTGTVAAPGVLKNDQTAVVRSTGQTRANLIDSGRAHVGGNFRQVDVHVKNEQANPDWVAFTEDLAGVSATSSAAGFSYTPASLATLHPTVNDTTTFKATITDTGSSGAEIFKTLRFSANSISLDGSLAPLVVTPLDVQVMGLAYSGRATWIAGSGNWTNGAVEADWARWELLGGIPGIDNALSSADTASFGGVGSNTVTLSGVTPRLQALNFTSTGGTTLVRSGSESIDLGLGLAAGSGVSISVSGGRHFLQVPVALHQNLTVDVVGQSKLTFGSQVTTASGVTSLAVTGTGSVDFLTGLTGNLDLSLRGATVSTGVNQSLDELDLRSGTLKSSAGLGVVSTVNATSLVKSTADTVVLGDKTNPGKLVIAGSLTLADVANGVLLVNADLQAPVLVRDGGTLGGNGRTRAVTVLGGGILSPGNSVDTITVTQLNLDPNATYLVELNATRADQTIVTTGQTVRAGKISVKRETGQVVVPADFKDKRYVIIQSQLGTQTGTFAPADVAFDSATALEFPSYAPKVEMNDKQTILYFQLTQNFGTPRTISSLPNIMGRTQSMFVHSITGDPYARLLARGPSSARGVTQNSLLSAKDDLDESVSGAFDNTWVEGYAQTIQAHQGSGNWGYDYQLGGVSAGIDLIRDKDWVMGLAFGLSQSESKHEYNHDKTSATAYDLGLYTAASGDDSTVSFVAFYSNYEVTHTRQVDMGFTTRPATGKPKAFRTGVELGYDTTVLRTPDSKTYLRMGLGAGLAHRNGFTETGEDAIIMNFDAVNMPYFQLDMGMGYSTDLFKEDKSWQLFGEGMFTRHVVGSNPTCQARFVNAVGSSGTVTVPSPEYTYIQFQPTVGVSWREGLGSAEFKVFAEIRGGKTAPGASASYKLRF